MAKHLGRYPAVRKLVNSRTSVTNFGVPGDKVEHALDRIIKGNYPTSIRYAFLIIGTNNVCCEKTSASQIASAIIGASKNLTFQLPGASVCIVGLLPREFASDKAWVNAKVRDINNHFHQSIRYKNQRKNTTYL